MAVPYIFQNASGNIPLANLDTNFDTPIVLGSTTIKLGDTVTSLGGLTAVTATTGSYTNLAVSGTVSGTGFSAYLASPPTIGGTVPGAGFFTSLTSNSTTTLNGTTIPSAKTLLVTTDIGTTVQENLVSGVNIKTINSTSLLGSGDITVGDVTTSGTQTLINKTISADNNTISGVAASSFVLSNGSGNIDGAAAQKAIPTGVVVGTTDTQALTNKTLTAPTISNLVMDGYIREEVFAVSGTTPALSPSNGTIQTWTLTGNSTPTQGTWTQGESMTLMINDGTAFTVNWASVPVVWVGGTAPTLATTGFTVIELWEVGTTIYGARVGNVA